LYRDVLCVSPDVSDREIRIAYFRRGREILGEASALSGLSSNNNNNNNIINKLDPETKLKFQAVSMAYEILSNPEWKETYLRQGGLKLTIKNKDKKNNNINNSRRTRRNDNGGDGDDEIRTMTTDTNTTRTTTSKPEREKQQRQHDDLFSSSPSAVAAAFPTVKTTLETNNSGGLVVPAVKNTNNNNNNNKIVRNNEIQFPLNIVQQQQQLIQIEFQQQQQQATPIVKRLPTALRGSSFTGRDNGNNDNASCTSSSSIKKINKRISRRTGTTTSSSVRWNDHVEELIFANHPNEHACSDNEDDDDTDDDDDDNDEGYDGDNDNIDIDIDDRTEDDDIVEEEERNHRRQQQTKKNKKNQNGSFPRLIGSGGGDNNNNNNNNNNGTTNQNGESYSVTIKSPASVSGHSSSHRSVGNSTTGSNSKRSNNKNKKKPKIVIDSEELESHLKRMDNEAEKHFVQDFWDNFEESMDGIMSLVDSLGGDASKKSSNNKRSASSWSSSILSSSKQQQRGRRNKNNDAAAGTISRSMSHDLISTNSTIYEEVEDAILKRSNSYPEGTISQHELVSSPQQQKSNTLSSSLGAAEIVIPDHHHHHHHDENTSSKRLDPPASEMQSPYEMVLNSWPFQSSSQNQQQQHEEYATSSTTTPAVVSPQSARRMTKSTIQDSYPQSSSPRLMVTSPPSDAATSLASDILSQQQLKQKLFRPISPALSEASEAITSGFDGGSSNSSDNINNRSLLSDDKFELGSRISEMDSLDLTEFDNPFRQQPSSSSPIKRDSTSNAPLLPPADVAMPISKSKNSQSELDEEKKVDIKSKFPPNDTNNAATATTTSTKKSKFRVSMVSQIRGISYDKELQPLSHDQVANKNGRASRTSRAESMEDVFAGVDEGSKQQQRCDVIDNNRRPLNLQDISIERSASHVSDLSESVYTSNKKSEDDEEGERIIYESRTADDPIVVSVSEAATVTFAPSTISESVMSSSTKKSIMMNSTTRSSVRSEASTGYSSYASTRDTNSVHSLESAAVDSSGFFDYFIRYVTAIMTECANMGPTNGAPAEYQQDFISLFSTDASAHKAEILVKANVLEQPSAMQRVPSSSTCSTRSSRGS
jgi:hypothetical protein